MNLIIKMEFGSKVYGTNLPTSDIDYKGIFIPSARDIILQKAKRTIQDNTKTDSTKKNSAEDIDFEIYSLQEFLKLALEGNTGAIDMLFTPGRFWKQVQTGPWGEIQRNKDKLLHRGVSSYVGYCRTQAAKYGLKGGRVATLRAAVELLNMCRPEAKLLEIWNTIEIFVKNNEHTAIVDIESKTLKTALTHWDVCNCKMGQTTTVGYAKEQFEKIFDNYGARALLAEKNQGVDFKALMHAVRVCGEAKELLLTGNITFPRPEAPVLLRIRKGELPYKEVAELIENGLQEVEIAKEKSILPEHPDKDFAEQLIYETYKDVIDKDE